MTVAQPFVSDPVRSQYSNRVSTLAALAVDDLLDNRMPAALKVKVDSDLVAAVEAQLHELFDEPLFAAGYDVSSLPGNFRHPAGVERLLNARHAQWGDRFWSALTRNAIRVSKAKKAGFADGYDVVTELLKAFLDQLQAPGAFSDLGPAPSPTTCECRDCRLEALGLDLDEVGELDVRLARAVRAGVLRWVAMADEIAECPVTLNWRNLADPLLALHNMLVFPIAANGAAAVTRGAHALVPEVVVDALNEVYAPGQEEGWTDELFGAFSFADGDDPDFDYDLPDALVRYVLAEVAEGFAAPLLAADWAS